MAIMHGHGDNTRGLAVTDANKEFESLVGGPASSCQRASSGSREVTLDQAGAGQPAFAPGINTIHNRLVSIRR